MSGLNYCKHGYAISLLRPCQVCAEEMRISPSVDPDPNKDIGSYEPKAGMRVRVEDPPPFTRDELIQITHDQAESIRKLGKTAVEYRQSNDDLCLKIENLRKHIGKLNLELKGRRFTIENQEAMLDMHHQDWKRWYAHLAKVNLRLHDQRVKRRYHAHNEQLWHYAYKQESKANWLLLAILSILGVVGAIKATGWWAAALGLSVIAVGLSAIWVACWAMSKDAR